MRPGRRHRASVLLSLLVLMAAACGGSTGGQGGTPSNTTIKLAGLYDITGEDSTASPEEDNAVKMAEADLATAGIKVDVTRYKRGADPTIAKTSLLQAISDKPDAMFGLDTTSVLAPLVPQIVTTGIPFIAIQTDPTTLGKLTFPNNIFSIRVPAAGGSAATTQYLLDTYKPKSVGLICVNSDFGTSACNADKKVLDKNSIKITNQVQAQPTSTDESAQAAAMLGSQMVLDEGFPSPIVLDIKAMTAQGLNVPVSAGASARFVAKAKALNATQLSQLFGFEDCTFDAGSDSSGFGQKYQTKYGAVPTYAAAETYDIVMILGKTIHESGTAHDKVNSALRKINYTGACSQYKGSGRYQMLNQRANIIGFDSTGAAKILGKVTVDLSTV